MKVPDITHLQFAVLSIIGGTERSGRTIREKLAEFKVKKTGPAFYQLMARMEENGLVKGWYEQEIIDGQIIKQRFYKAKGKGITAANKAREFYLGAGLDAAFGVIAHG